MNTFSRHALAEIIELGGLQQTDIAAAAGVHVSYVGHQLHGRMPVTETVADAAKKLATEAVPDLRDRADQLEEMMEGAH